LRRRRPRGARASLIDHLIADDHYRASFDLVTEAGLIDEDFRDRLAPSVGLRNVLAHEYVAIDLSVVAEAVDRAVIDCGDYVSSAASWLASV
jgi:uncharacterized protein YutE (UPF0331/DUF86 family)